MEPDNATRAAPNINSSRKLMGDHVLAVSSGWENARQYYHRKFRRGVENWRFYWAHDPELGFGQWPEDAVNYMVEQKRQLLQYNFVKVIVDTIAGGIMQVPFDPEFYPVNDEMTSLTKAIKKAMYSDKELLDWNSTYFELVRAGLIHEGVIKMYLDYTYDKELGNIGFRNCLPDSVMADPYWKSWASKDCKKCWHETWHTPEDLLRIYPEKEKLLGHHIGASKGHADEYGAYSGPIPYSHSGTSNSVDSYGKWGDVHRLIQQYRMENKTFKDEYALTADGEILIPEHIDDMDKPQWLNTFHPSWDPTRVFYKDREEKMCIVEAIVPTISGQECFECGEVEIQIGRLPFFFWAASRANGESDSIVDSIKDPQMYINYMESLITHKIQVEGGGGAQLADRQAFASDGEYERYKANRNDPAATFEVRPGLFADENGSAARPVFKTGVPTEAYTAINHIVSTILPQISKVTPSMRGMGQGQGESGKLFELMKIQSDQQVYTIHYGLRIFWNEVYEAYFMQASKQYSKGGVERTFSYNKGKNSISLNQRIEFPDGTIAIKNDVSKLRQIRHKVIIGDKQESPTEKAENLNTISRFLKSIGQGSPLISKYLINKASSMMSMLDEEDQEAIEILGDKELDLQIAQLDVKTLQTQMQREQLEEQKSAMEQDQVAKNQGQEMPEMPQGPPEQSLQSQPSPGPQAPEMQPIMSPQGTNQEIL